MVSPGASVTEGQPVMELETDKAVVEVPSSVSGTVKEIRVKEGEKIKVGQVIFTVENGAGAKAKAAEPTAQPTKPASREASARAAKPAAPAEAAAAARGADCTARRRQLRRNRRNRIQLPELGENIDQGDWCG